MFGLCNGKRKTQSYENTKLSRCRPNKRQAEPLLTQIYVIIHVNVLHVVRLQHTEDFVCTSMKMFNEKCLIFCFHFIKHSKSIMDVFRYQEALTTKIWGILVCHYEMFSFVQYTKANCTNHTKTYKVPHCEHPIRIGDRSFLNLFKFTDFGRRSGRCNILYTVGEPGNKCLVRETNNIDLNIQFTDNFKTCLNAALQSSADSRGRQRENCRQQCIVHTVYVYVEVHTNGNEMVCLSKVLTAFLLFIYIIKS